MRNRPAVTRPGYLHKNRNNQRGDPVFDVDLNNVRFRAFYESAPNT